MGTSFSTLFRANRRRDEAIDASLCIVQASLQTLGFVAGLLPVAGVGVVVTILQAMMQQIQETRMNSKTAGELRDEIFDLTQSIGNIVREMNDTVKPNIQSLSDEQKKFIRTAQVEKPSLFKKIVDKLIEDLRPLQDDIKKARAGSWLSRLFCSHYVKLQLDEVRFKIAAAKGRFQLHQSIVVARTVEELETHVEDLRAMQVEALSKIDINKYDNDLRGLKRADAAHDAVGDSGYIEGTRIGILEEICEWSERTGEDTLRKFFLLIGEGGTGKSTIARKVCFRLRKEGSLGASFFFVRSDVGALGSVQSVWPTIAFQLASLQKRFRQHIAEAARVFINLPSESLKKQMESLILNPLKKVQDERSSQTPKPIVIVIDALDEASGELVTFVETLKELVDKEPRLRVFITTRPESPIMRTFKSAGIDSIGKRKFMNDIPLAEADSDIRRFLEIHFDKFWYRDKLLAKHPDAIARLTERSERLFIYARTVIQFLTCKAWAMSLERLDMILLGGPVTSGMSELRKLYSTVLKNAYDEGAMENETIRNRVKGVLAGLVILQEQATVKLLAPLVEVTEDEVVETVEELRSIVTYTGDIRKNTIRPLHLTLREFLVDEERCPKDFYVDRREYHLRVVKSCLRIMNNELRRDICRLGGTFKEDIKDLESRVQEWIPAHVQYACLYWTAHLVESDPTIDAGVRSLLEQFCTTKVLEWIEVLSLMNRLDLAVHALVRVRPWTTAFTGAATILEDALRFVARFYEPINECPAQIYTSALSIAPECSLVDLYAKENQNNCMISRRERLWGTCLNSMSAKSSRALYSRDGRVILSWSGNEIMTRDSMTGNAWKTLWRGNNVVSVDSHPNGRFVVFLLEDGRVEEWDWISESHSSRIYALPEVDRNESTSMHGQVTYGGTGSRIVGHWGAVDAIFVWSTDDQTQPAERIPIPKQKRCETFSLDAEGEYMVALLTSRSELAIVKHWDIKTGKEVSSLQIEIYELEQAVFAKNNNILVTGHGGKICVWNVEGDCWTLTTTINELWLAFDVTRSGDVIASGTVDICFWGARSGEKLGKYHGHAWLITSLRFSAQEDRLVSTSDDGFLHIWNTAREALHQSSDHTLDLSNVTFSPNGKFIAATSGDDVYIIDGKDGSLFAKLAGHTYPARSIVFSADSSVLATYSKDDGVFLWEVERKLTHPWTLSQSKRLGKNTELTLNMDATLLAAVSQREDSFTIRIWDLKNRPNETSGEVGEKVFQSDHVHGSTPHYIRFDFTDPLSLLRLLEQDENEVIIWDRTRNALETCAYDENIHSALKPAFGEEEGWIISTKTRRRLLWLPEDRRTRYATDFAAIGNMVAVGSDAGKFTVLDMSRLTSL